jgi:hypothetical protein
MNFRDILSEYNIATGPMSHYHVREGWIQFDCPYCSPDSQGWYMGYSIEGRFLNCWRCGNKPLFPTLRLMTGLSEREVKNLLGDFRPEHIERRKPKGKLILPQGIGDLQAAHKKYIKKRGFDYRELQQLWKIQAIGLANKLSWRIFIPIHYHGEIVSWTTRSISDKILARYVSAGVDEEAMPHKELLYGEDFARHAVIVQEGIFDVWRIGPGAVATFGVNYSEKQVERIAKYPTRAICFDNEFEAQRRARKLADDLSVFPGETFNVVLDAKDADDESTENIERLRKEILG